MRIALDSGDGRLYELHGGRLLETQMRARTNTHTEVTFTMLFDDIMVMHGTIDQLSGTYVPPDEWFNVHTWAYGEMRKP